MSVGGERERKKKERALNQRVVLIKTIQDFFDKF